MRNFPDAKPIWEAIKTLSVYVKRPTKIITEDSEIVNDLSIIVPPPFNSDSSAAQETDSPDA